MPISIVYGNTMSFSFEFTLDGAQQLYSDYTFLGNVKDVQTNALLATFVFAQNIQDPNLIDVTLDSNDTRIDAKEYRYEIKAVHNTTAVVTTIMRGNFIIEPTYVGI